MTHHMLDLLRAALVHYGYWAVAAALLLENAGLPVPGESILLLASFLAYSEGELQFGRIVLVGTIAATIGDNIGYVIGYYGGRPLLLNFGRAFRVNESALRRGEKLFADYGPPTILFARFVFGMRIIAGPLAGVLRMNWKRFAVFNLLGAAIWVTAISCVGYFFGSRWSVLIHFMKRFDMALTILFAAAVAVLWRRNRNAKYYGKNN